MSYVFKSAKVFFWLPLWILSWRCHSFKWTHVKSLLDIKTNAQKAVWNSCMFHDINCYSVQKGTFTHISGISEIFLLQTDRQIEANTAFLAWNSKSTPASEGVPFPLFHSVLFLQPEGITLLLLSAPVLPLSVSSPPPALEPLPLAGLALRLSSGPVPPSFDCKHKNQVTDKQKVQEWKR